MPSDKKTKWAVKAARQIGLYHWRECGGNKASLSNETTRDTAAIIDRHAPKIDAEGLAEWLKSKFHFGVEITTEELTAEIREFLAKKEAQR
jgi:hypothetical protein